LLARILGWIIIVIIVVFIITNPYEAGSLVRDWIDAIITFFSSLAGGGSR
jgi:hypothetical protein